MGWQSLACHHTDFSIRIAEIGPVAVYTFLLNHLQCDRPTCVAGKPIAFWVIVQIQTEIAARAVAPDKWKR
jgi:hypothetical protein